MTKPNNELYSAICTSLSRLYLIGLRRIAETRRRQFGLRTSASLRRALRKARTGGSDLWVVTGSRTGRMVHERKPTYLVDL